MIATQAPSLLPAVLACAAVAVVLGVPRSAGLRLPQVITAPARAPRQRQLRPVYALAAAVPAIGWLGPAAAALVCACGIGIAVARRARARHRAAASERRCLLEACVALAAELRAGRSPAEALDVAAGLAEGASRQALRAATAAARLGGDVPGALLAPDAGDSAAPEVLRALAACWQVCARAGGGLAVSIDRLADAVRAREVQQRAVESALAGPRASAGLVALLPLAGIALAAGLGARPVHVLLHTSVGLVCLVAGVALDGLGLWWTTRIVARASRTAR